MGRLTEKQSSGYDLKAMNGEYCNKYCEQQRVETCNECVIYQAIQKLAQFEDLEELIGIPLKKITEILHQNIPEDCKHPQKAVVLTDDDVDRWEKYKDFAAVFRKKMTETVCEFLSDKEEFGKWLDRNKWIAGWLEELKALKNGLNIKCDSLNEALEKGKKVGYSKALDDFANTLKENYDYLPQILSQEAFDRYIDEYAEQLKAGGNHA